MCDTRHTGDVLIDLSRRLGGSVARAFPWLRYEEAIVEALAGIQASGGGSFTASTPRTFFSKLLERGVWSGPPHQEDPARPLATPTGKIELFPVALKRAIEERAAAEAKPVEAVLDALDVSARGDAAFMAHWEPPRSSGDAERFPLALHTFKTMMQAEGRGANQPWLQESFGLQLGERWGPWAEINPEVARDLGIRDRDEIWIESPNGRLRLRARLHPGVHPGVVNVPFEYGHTAYGRWARRMPGNPNEIASTLRDPLAALDLTHVTSVRVVRA